MGGGGGGGGEQVTYEPVKSVEQSMKDAQSETIRAQQLRRGITSTFNRKMMTDAGAVSASSGGSSKLGG